MECLGSASLFCRRDGSKPLEITLIQRRVRCGECLGCSSSHGFARDLLEQGAKSSTLTTPHEARTNHIDHPKSAVFVVQDSSLPALSTATVAQGVRLFEELSGSTVPGVSGLGERFGTLAEVQCKVQAECILPSADLAQGNGTKIYVVNGTKAANSVSKAIVAATNRVRARRI